MLSALNFIINNKRKILIIVLIVIISTFTINLSTTLINSLYDTCYDVGVEPYNEYTIVYGNDTRELIDFQSVEKIRSSDEIQSIYNVIIETTSIKTIFGTTSANIYFINDNEEISKILDEMKMTLMKGTLPVEGAKEILLHTNIAINKGINIGDFIGDYKIVGIIDGETQICIGALNEMYQEVFNETPMALLLLPKNDTNITEMNKQLADMKLNDLEIYGLQDAQKDIDDEFSNINIILNLIIVMIAVSLSIASAALVFAIYSNRYDEFGILHALGYNKREIRKLIFKEVFLISVIGWLIGYVISLICLKLIDYAVYSGMGQKMSIITFNGIVQSLIVPIGVFVFTIIPVLRKLKKTDLISIIERR